MSDLADFLLDAIAHDEERSRALHGRADSLLRENGGDRLAALEVLRFEMDAEGA